MGPSGCIGGRKLHEAAAASSGRDLVHFTDSQVSLSHFEVSYSVIDSQFMIRDLGSAGGTFVRINFGSKKKLLPGAVQHSAAHACIPD